MVLAQFAIWRKIFHDYPRIYWHCRRNSLNILFSETPCIMYIVLNHKEFMRTSVLQNNIKVREMNKVHNENKCSWRINTCFPRLKDLSRILVLDLKIFFFNLFILESTLEVDPSYYDLDPGHQPFFPIYRYFFEQMKNFQNFLLMFIRIRIRILSIGIKKP